MEHLIADYRHRIQAGTLTPADFRTLLRYYTATNVPEIWSDPPRYDQLDTFVDELFQLKSPPQPLHPITPEMIPYQTTPIRLVLDMVDRLRLTSSDVVYDLGAGLGRVVFTIALLCTSEMRGVEIEPAYVAYAQHRAQDLKLTRTSFINTDARAVDYSDGTVFFLYTPFKGTILRRVLALLRAQSRTRQIRLCTYGPGTLEVQDQDWLASDDDPERDIHHITIFESKRTSRRAPVMRRRQGR